MLQNEEPASMFNPSFDPLTTQQNLQHIASGNVLSSDRIIKRVAASTG
jgi:hypothetical protein